MCCVLHCRRKIVKNAGDSDLQLLVVMGCPRPSIAIYPHWNSTLAEATCMFP
jgi:hypothetical protein